MALALAMAMAMGDSMTDDSETIQDLWWKVTGEAR
jgi:hypothetical protein